MLDGNPPLAVAIVGALAVMLITLASSHGIGPITISAALGTTASLAITASLAVLFTELAHVTGFASEEASLLRATAPGLSVEGLLLAGIIIAALGVLDDVTISQASTVFALQQANPHLGFGRLFTSALNVGRDHITATVNTLVLAYAGA
ncbi:MAG: YibE/F family protein, partial [Gaiellaceae bacterium]